MPLRAVCAVQAGTVGSQRREVDADTSGRGEATPPEGREREGGEERAQHSGTNGTPRGHGEKRFFCARWSSTGCRAARERASVVCVTVGCRVCPLWLLFARLARSVLELFVVWSLCPSRRACATGQMRWSADPTHDGGQQGGGDEGTTGEQDTGASGTTAKRASRHEHSLTPHSLSLLHDSALGFSLSI